MTSRRACRIPMKRQHASRSRPACPVLAVQYRIGYTAEDRPVKLTVTVW